MSPPRHFGRDATVIDFILNPQLYSQPTTRQGLYRAWCRSGANPELDDPMRRGRIRVYIPAMHPESIPDEHLPWAEACYADGGGPGYGDFHVPGYNDTVWVMFEQGDPQRPVWMGTWYGFPSGATETPSAAYTETAHQTRAGIERYPKRRVIRTRYGHSLEFGDDEDELEVVVSTRNGNRVVVRDSPSRVEGGETVRSMGVRLEDQNGNFLHLDPDARLFSIYFHGNKVETIVGDVVLQVRADPETGRGGNVLIEHDGTNVARSRGGG